MNEAGHDVGIEVGPDGLKRYWYHDALREDDKAVLRTLAGLAGGGWFLEVGTHCGGSAACLLEGMAGPGCLVCVDTWTGTPGDRITEDYASGEVLEIFLARMEHQGQAGRVLPVRGRSGDVLPMLSAGWFSLVFIDGDHREAAVRADIQNGKRLARPGGILCGHDYNAPWHPDVGKVVNDELGTPAQLAPDSSVWAFWKTDDGWEPVMF